MSGLSRLSDIEPGERAMLQKAWSEIPPARRRQIAGALVELAEDNIEMDFRTVFFLLLDDEDEDVRAAAIEGLWEDEGTALAGHLLDLLKRDPSPKVRAAAAVGLGRFTYLAELEELDEAWCGRLKSTLLEIIYDSKETMDVRRRAVEAIGYFSGDDEVAKIIERAYDDSDEVMKTSAVFAMGRNMNPRWLKSIVNELHSGKPAMRYEAARASGEMARKEAVPHLVPLIGDDDPEVRLAAIWALGQIGGKKATEVLTRCAYSEDEAVREAAEEALDELQFSADPLGWSYTVGPGD